MQRSEYMTQYGTGTREQDAALHRAYYAQFVTGAIRDIVRSRIGEDRIRRSTDPHFNNIPLDAWDLIILPNGVRDSLRLHGDFFTQAGATCILKEAAQQIREGR